MKAWIQVILLAIACVLAVPSGQAASYELWAAGTLWNTTNHGIARFNVTDGSFIGYFMHPTNGTGLVVNPSDGTITGVGTYGRHLFVGHYPSNQYYRVARYDLNGANATIDFITGAGGNWRFGSYYYPVRSFAFDSGYVYLLAGVFSTVSELESGTYMFRHTSAGAVAGNQPNTIPSGYSRGAQFSAPTNMAAVGSTALGLTRDASGNFYALRTPPSVYRFAPDGSYYGPGGMGDTSPLIASNDLPVSFRDAAGIVIDNAGRLYLGGKTGTGGVTTSLLLRYNADGTPAGTNLVDAIFSRWINYLKGVVTPVTLAIGPVDGYLYVGNGYVSDPRYENMINRFYTSGVNDGKIVEEGGFANLGGSSAPIRMPNISLFFVNTETTQGTVFSVR